ncbi:MAG: hypothetical protein ACYSTS_19405 [Planctomycetota bacterium]|jgi:hypothetical protein
MSLNPINVLNNASMLFDKFYDKRDEANVPDTLTITCLSCKSEFDSVGWYGNGVCGPRVSFDLICKKCAGVPDDRNRI